MYFQITRKVSTDDPDAEDASVPMVRVPSGRGSERLSVLLSIPVILALKAGGDRGTQSTEVLFLQTIIYNCNVIRLIIDNIKTGEIEKITDNSLSYQLKVSAVVTLPECRRAYTLFLL